MFGSVPEKDMKEDKNQVKWGVFLIDKGETASGNQTSSPTWGIKKEERRGGKEWGRGVLECGEKELQRGDRNHRDPHRETAEGKYCQEGREKARKLSKKGTVELNWFAVQLGHHFGGSN